MNPDRKSSVRSRAYTDKTQVMRRPDLPEADQEPDSPRSARPPTGEQTPRPAVRRSVNATRSVSPRLQRRKQGIALRRFLLLPLAVLAVLLVAAIWMFVQVSSVAGSVVVADARLNPPLFSSVSGGSNILIIGVDERPDHPEEGVRSDTLIVAHLNGGARWVNLLSVPRDTLAEIPQYGASKINVAYGFGYSNAEELFGAGVTPQQGGMALAAETVENLLRLQNAGQRIDYTAQINFDGFARIIDALGGITINVPTYILDEEYPTADFGVMRVEFQPGPQRMNGETALIYARTRHGDSDFERGARQQQVMRAMLAEIKAKGPIGAVLAIPGIGDSLQGAVATTLPVNRPDVLLNIIWLASGLNPDEIGQLRLSDLDPNVQQDGAFNLIWSDAGLQDAVNALLTRPEPAAEQAVIQVLNGTGVSGLAGRVSGELETAGFSVIPAGDAPAEGVQRTVVYNLNNKPQTAERLAQTLNARVEDGLPAGVTTTADIVVILGADAAN